MCIIDFFIRVYFGVSCPAASPSLHFHLPRRKRKRPRRTISTNRFSSSLPHLADVLFRLLHSSRLLAVIVDRRTLIASEPPAVGRYVPYVVRVRTNRGQIHTAWRWRLSPGRICTYWYVLE